MRLSLSVAAALSFMAAGAPAQTRVDAIAAGDATETTAIAWVRARELRDYPMPPADVVLVERLIEREAA